MATARFCFIGHHYYCESIYAIVSHLWYVFHLGNYSPHILGLFIKQVEIYYKRQKLTREMFRQSTEFHPNVRKTFMVFASSVLEKAIA